MGRNGIGRCLRGDGVRGHRCSEQTDEGIALDSTDARHHAPFIHPRRDAYLGRARRLAALFLSLTQGLWFIAFVWAVQNGARLTPTFSVLGLAGIFFIAARVGRTAEIALALSDRLSGLEWAPPPGEIARRLVMELLVPLGLFALAFLLRENGAAVFACLAAVALLELADRVLALGSWRHANVHPDLLVSLMSGSPDGAVEKFAAQRDLTGLSLEVSALAIAGVSIRGGNVRALRALGEALESKQNDAAARRALAVVRADLARAENAATASMEEARALALVPVGHPRRLALALFVATAALEQRDGESAAKALGLLHSRDVPIPAGRVLVNWLLLQAADMIADEALAKRVREALRAFDVRRVARGMTVESAADSPDPYARWIHRAHAELSSGVIAGKP